MNSLHNTNRRLGVTLIEMLVVVAIMMFMLAIAAPMFRTDQDGAVARDTARALNAYIQEARAKAMATGRPCGVAFIPFGTYTSACVVAQQVETPPLYTGGSYQSTVTVAPQNANETDLSKLVLTLTFHEGSVIDVDTNWKKAGNMIRFGGRGVWYEMTGPTACKLQSGDYTRLDAEFRPWTNGNWTTTYEIQAVPVSKADNYLQAIGMAEPFKVIRGSAIDLYYSKVGGNDIKNSSNNPIVVMFNPTGEVGLCYNLSSSSSGSGRGRTGTNASSTSTPPDTIHILCGQWDRSLITPTKYEPEDGKWNYQTFDSYWIHIDPATGNSTIEQNIPN